MGAWPRVAVMGGSVAGLSAALVLRDLGCRVDVFERSGRALESRGAGIGMHPMTIRYFRESDALDAARVEIELPWLRFLDAAGETVHEEVMNYRFSSWSTIYRGLLGCFDPSRYHLGAEVVGLVQDETGVSISFAGGTTHRADLLVCADGISSMARAALLPAARPRYAGYVAWRATLPESDLSRDTAAVLGTALTYCVLPDGHVLAYPIPGLAGELEPGRRLANLVWYHNYKEGSELEELLTGHDGTRHELSVPPGTVSARHVEWARAFARKHMAPPIAEILQMCAQPFVQVIYDIEIERMAFGRVCLIGDAAFAVRPHAAAGTAKACADAWSLRDALRDAAGDPVAALAAWEPGQLQLGRALLARTREMGERSQFRRDWTPGDPSLRLGLYGPGR